MNFPLIANVVVFVVLLLLLAQARHKQWSLAKKVLVGLAMGVVFGLALQAIYGSDNPVLKDSIQWFNIVGNGYVQLLQMIVMPLVFASILSAVARLHNATQLGKISFLTIGTLLFTTLIAALVGVLVTNLFGLTAEGLVQGTAETARLTAIQTNYVGKVADLTVPQMVLSFIPKNPFADLTGASPTSIISVVIFAAFLGVAALKLLKEYLPASYHEGSKNPVARERVHSAATIAGIAFANAFLGVCHSMAHKLGSQFHIPHGLANALLICNVIRYNANDNPTKQTAFSQYDRPQARRRYAEIADHLGLSAPGDRTAAKIEKLLAWLESVKAELGIPKSIREAGVQEADFLAHVDKLSEDAFDDQCTGANPRYPLISELKQILLDTYYGREFVEGEAAAKAEAAPVKAEKKAKKSA